MSTAGLNSLALRFGSFSHGSGGVGLLVLLLYMFGILICAIPTSSRADSQKS